MNYVIKRTGLMFKQDMILAYLQGIKNQTRRTKGLTEINEKPDEWDLIFTPLEPGTRFVSFGHKVEKSRIVHVKMPYGCMGDMLYFKETWRMWERPEDGKDFLHYRADDAKVDPVWWSEDEWTRPDPVWAGRFDKWQPSMFMPMVCSRFRDVPIMEVRVERLQDLDFSDAYHEGCPREYAIAPIAWYRNLWDSINGKTLPWISNPWVWVYRFLFV